MNKAGISKNLILGLALALLALFALRSYAINKTDKRFKYSAVQGNVIKIERGQHRMVAEKTIEFKGTFLLAGGFAPHTASMDFFSASFSAIPFGKIQDLKAQYGDIWLCRSPGARQAQRAGQSMILLAETPEVERKIRGVMRLVRKNTFPVIDLAGTELRIVEHTYRGEPFTVSGIGPYYLINEAMIMYENGRK